MVYLNNLLSLPLAAALAAATGELAGVAGDPALRRPGFAGRRARQRAARLLHQLHSALGAPQQRITSRYPNKSGFKVCGCARRELLAFCIRFIALSPTALLSYVLKSYTAAVWN